MDSRAAAPGSINSVATPDTAPASGAHAETAGKHEVEEAERLIAAFERDIDDFGLSGCQQFASACQAQLGMFLTKRHSDNLVKEAVQMARRAARQPGQLREIHAQQIRGGCVPQKVLKPFFGVKLWRGSR